MKIQLIVAFLLCMFVLPIQSQNPMRITLEECNTLAKQNYPLVKQYELIEKSKDYSIENAGKGYLPQININGQVSYQSAVTELPIHLPNLNIPSLNKDQYKLYAEINQPVYDGGMVKLQKKAQEVNASVEMQRLDIEMYKLKDRINQLFFGILLAEEQLKQLELMRSDLQNALNKMEASITNGTAFKSNRDVLKVEKLKLEQREIEFTSNRQAYIQMLGLFLNLKIDTMTIFVKPYHKVVTHVITRPELSFFEQQKRNIDLQQEILRVRINPKCNLFLQAGYGRPGLNMLSNTFGGYYIGGIRLNWSLNGFYTLKTDKAFLDITRKNIDLQKELFLYNITITLDQQSIEVQKLSALIRTDDEIISLRSQIKSTSSVQLNNGVISSNDFVRELNAEDQAKETKITHEIQLLMAEYTQQITTGE